MIKTPALYVLLLFSLSMPCWSAQKPTVSTPERPLTIEGVVNKTKVGFCERLLGSTKEFLSRLYYFPQAMRNMREIVGQEFSPEKLDEKLYAFWGFHQDPNEAAFRQRPWDKEKPGNAKPDQVEGMPVDTMIAALQYAMEIEDPIMRYTEESGKGFRYLLPNLGRFMGKNEEQAAYVHSDKNSVEDGERTKVSWCESPWCAEENRHGTMWARILRALTGIEPERGNAATPTITTNTEEGAAAHFADRQGTEWGASSAYLLFAAHAKGPLRNLILNVMRDEIKHLVIVSSADVYLYGYRPNFRSFRIVRKIVRDFFEGLNARSSGKKVSSDPFVIAEVIAAHVMIEVQMRKYLRSLPLSTLTKIFESQSLLPELKAIQISEDQVRKNKELEAKGTAVRLKLGRWQQEQRDFALAQREFEFENQPAIDQIVQTAFDSFAGTEDSKAAFDSALEKIHTMNLYEYWPGDTKKDRIARMFLKAALVDRLYDHRIMNNPLAKKITNSK